MIAQILCNASSELQPMPTGVAPRLQKLDGISAVLFDVYGTLLISASGDIGTDCEERRPRALTDALAAVGLKYRGTEDEGIVRYVHSIEQRHVELRAEGIDFPEIDIVDIWRTIVADLQREGLIDSETVPTTRTLSTEAAERLAVEYEVRTNPVWPMPGCEDTLAALRRANLTLGIISNAQFYTPLLFPALLGKDLDALGFCSELRIYSYQFLRAKPGLALYELAREQLRQMGVSADRVLYVGNDMLKDIWPAQRIGFRTALFAGDARSLKRRLDDPRVADVEPDLIVTDLVQIPPCLTDG